MKVTIEALWELGACEEACEIFRKLWPEGVEITLENLLGARQAKLDVFWLVFMLPLEGPTGQRGFALWCMEQLEGLYDGDVAVKRCLDIARKAVKMDSPYRWDSRRELLKKAYIECMGKRHFPSEHFPEIFSACECLVDEKPFVNTVSFYAAKIMANRAWTLAEERGADGEKAVMEEYERVRREQVGRLFHCFQANNGSISCYYLNGE
jgi:hypothetical protein